MEIIAKPPLQKSNYRLLFRYIIITAFTAGSLDALAAIFILSHGNAQSIFKFIASGIYGKDAFTGGAGMVQLGIVLHYFIAFCVTIFYFVIFKYVAIFHKSVFVSTIIYGLFIYIIMNIVVLSLSNVNIPPRTAISVIRNSIILIVCIAFPIVCFNRVYNSKR
ncbi:hypothetical protein [Mucilaginibacter sp. OK098]|uniref:hypothetical protein n=1 Tax=Mucilaginibacter sp. OK098 TaxID=1855297 RepID=UPI00091E33A8|nr:hypothetical protein [Mucilaginibacter sp. OK098]SHN37558.1 hypothetical protein SAMN05216524_11610 [Mucilaginibacter sp. OK098]